MAAVMLIYTMAQIVGEPLINLSGMRDATEEINVVHHGPPSRDTRRLYNVTLIETRDSLEQ